MKPAVACTVAAGAALLLGIQLGRGLQQAPTEAEKPKVEPKVVEPGKAAAPTVESKRIDGKAIAGDVRAEVKEEAERLEKEHGVKPGLAVILVGSRKDSETYVRNKKKSAAEVNFHTVDINLPESVSEAVVLEELDKLNKDPKVHAILVQLPLPKHIDEAKVLKSISVEKDADGFSALNIGNLCLKGGDPPLAVPCTPAGCIEMLQRSGVDCSGKNAVVIGRSNIVGMPVSQLLQSMDATVTVCHSRTKDIASYVRNADIVIAAIGKPNFVRGEWLKPGCVVIDVGINPVEDATKKTGYRLVGDVNFAEAQGVASQITPVPGGVGPMTIAMLLKNTLNLALTSLDLPRLRLRKKVADEEARAEAKSVGIADAKSGGDGAVASPAQNGGASGPALQEGKEPAHQA
jgi:5,10-methylene-tetrahydrofolate dehydrogenase/methenyl tetrahydrofolate cyclohydrolase